MKLIPVDQVRGWGQSGDDRWPTGLDTACPRCRREAFLTVNANQHTVNGQPAAARCVRCNQTSRVYVVRDASQTTIYLYPHPGAVLPPELDSLAEDEFPEPLRAAYASTKRVLAMGEPVAAHVSARRVLEGICWAALPQDQAGGSLFEQLEALVNHRRLGAEMATLMTALRKAGNLGAHFDHKRTPTPESAENMVRLLDFLIETLYVVPAQVRDLERIFADAAAADSGHEADESDEDDE